MPQDRYTRADHIANDQHDSLPPGTTNIQLSGSYLHLVRLLRELGPNTPAGPLLFAAYNPRIDRDSLVRVLEDAIPTLPVEIAAVIRPRQLTVLSGDKYKVNFGMTESEVKRGVRAIHTHTTSAPPSAADLTVANNLPSVRTWVLMTPDGHYKYKAKNRRGRDDIEVLMDKVEGLSLKFGIQNGLINKQEIIGAIDQHYSRAESGVRKDHMHALHLKPAVDSIVSAASIKGLSQEQQRAVLEIAAADIGRAFLREFEQLGYSPQTAQRFMDMPIFKILDEGISAGIISVSGITKILMAEYERFAQRAQVIKELAERNKKLQRMITEQGIDSRGVMDELVTAKNSIFHDFMLHLEELGITNQILFEQTQTVNDQEFNTKDIATQRIDRQTLLQLL